MAENSWHRYDMKKLRHCHPMYSPVNFTDELTVQECVGSFSDGSGRLICGWLGVLGVVDTRFGVSQPAADAER